MKTRAWDRLGNGGLAFTELGFGSGPLGNLMRAISEDEAQATLHAAWDGGIRYFDTAPLYGLGLSETRLNRFLREKPRDEFVLSTKVGRLIAHCSPEERAGVGMFHDVPTRREIFDYSYDGVMRSIEDSFQRLGVDRFDILLAHDLDVFTHGSKATSDRHIDAFMGSGYRALVELRDAGAIRAFGAGVNEWEVCQALAERGDFDLFLLAGRYTLLEQEALDSFLPLCEERGIGIILGGPYNSGILATGAVPGAYYNYDAAPPAILERVRKIEAVCKTHDVPLIAAALQFPLFHPSVVSIIPGGQSPSQVHSNLAVLERPPAPPAFWAELKAKNLLRADAPTP